MLGREQLDQATGLAPLPIARAPALLQALVEGEHEQGPGRERDQQEQSNANPGQDMAFRRHDGMRRT
jgi:hypothetical protein